MCGSDAPDPPDLRAQADAMERIADKNLAFQGDMMDRYFETYDRTQGLLEETLGSQRRIAEEQWEIGKQDRARYQEKFQPLEDQLIKDAQTYSSPEKQQLEAARAQAAVQQTFDQQQKNAEQRLAGMGVDISQVSATAMDRDARNQMAATQALAGNQARVNTENMGRAMRSEAINVGKGYPGQINAAYGGANQGYNSMVANNATGANTGLGMAQAGNSFGNSALSGYNSSVNTLNANYANQLNAYNSSSSGMESAMGLLGAAAGGASMFGFNEGGMVPDDGAGPAPVAIPTDHAPGEDTIDAKLTKGEFVVPKDVVAWKGQEFFEKLSAKSRQDKQMSQMDSGAAGPQGIPVPPKPPGQGGASSG